MKPQPQKSSPQGNTTQDRSPCCEAGLPVNMSQLGAHLLRLTGDQGGDAPPASLPAHHLLLIARQSGLCEMEKCINTLGILALGREVRHQLLETLQKLHLSESRFLALVTLYALDPVPSNPADLAYHAEATRPSMTEALNQMEAQGWISREHIQDDRRVVHVNLTARGRELAATAIRQFLQKAGELGEGLSQPQQRAFSSIFTRILKNTTRAEG